MIFFDVFPSKEFVTWRKHPRILDDGKVTWARQAIGAPSAIERDGTYFPAATTYEIIDRWMWRPLTRPDQLPDGVHLKWSWHPLTVSGTWSGAPPVDLTISIRPAS